MMEGHKEPASSIDQGPDDHMRQNRLLGHGEHTPGTYCVNNELTSKWSHQKKDDGMWKTSSKKNGACLKGSKKCLQPDGQKLIAPSTSHEYGDMSRGTVRNATFQKFPHRLIVYKIMDSGYFYTGEGDKTMCHKCFAVVYDWNEKDDPAIFHEPSCEYYRNEEPMTEDPDLSLEGNSMSSLLDTPITELSTSITLAPTILTPTAAPTHVSVNSNIGSIQNTLMVPEVHGGPSGHQSLPLFGNRQSDVTSSATDIFIPHVVIESHKELLKGLDLCSEEDRRKSFRFKDAWKQNTNNVVGSRKLAACGFFYLGNLARTQCFSCAKVLKGWQRRDKVKVVHKAAVPHCRMVQGTETRNIPVIDIQRPVNASLPFASQPLFLDPPSSLAAAPTTLCSSVTDPNESSLEISKPSLTSAQILPVGTVRPNRPAQSASEELPLDLTVKPPSLGLAEMQSGSQYQESNVHMAIVPEDTKIDDHFPTQVSGNNESEAQQAGDVPTTLSFPSVFESPFAAPPPETLFISPVDPGPARGEWAEAFPCNEPENPEMRSAIARQDTFDYRWTQRGIGDTAEIARAGFYSTGLGDETRCWYCGGRAQRWNRQDDPWEEHAKLFPNCEFLLQHKGPDFVAEVSSRRRPPSPVMPPARPPLPTTIHTAHFPLPDSDDDESPYASMEVPRVAQYGSPFTFGWQRQHNSPPRVVDPREEAAKNKRTLDATLDSEMVLRAVEMGFEMTAVRRAVKKRIRETNSAFANSEALLEALLNPPQEYSSSSDDEGPSQSMVPRTPTTATPTATTTNLTTQGGARGEDQPSSSSMEGVQELVDEKQLDEKLRGYEQEKRCKVCLDRDAEVVFVPCGHLCTCTQCAGVLRTCPLCRKRIQKSMKIYTT